MLGLLGGAEGREGMSAMMRQAVKEESGSSSSVTGGPRVSGLYAPLRSATMQSVAVLGASGYLAQSLLRRLEHHASIDRIVGVDTVPPRHHPARLEFHPADLRQAPLASLIRGVHAVVYVASPPLPRAQRPEPPSTELLLKVVQACRDAGARRLVVVTSAAAFGAHADNPIPIQEFRPFRPNSGVYVSEYWAAMESVLEQLSPADAPPVTEPASDGLHIVRLRTALPIGPELPDAFAEVFRTRRILLPRQAAPIQLLHTEDLASAIQCVLEGGERNVYQAAAPLPMAPDELFEAAGFQVLRLPRSLLEVFSQVAWHAGRGKIPHDLLKLSEHPLLLSTVTLQHELGWQPRHSTLEALKLTCEQLRS